MTTACLLLHGFTSTPFEMEHFVAPLEAAGCVVENPLLPGHGTSIEDLNRTGFDDWVAGAEEAYLSLAARAEQVFIVGMSLGGSIGLALAEKHEPAGLMTMAAPVYIYRWFPPEACDWRLPLVPLLKRLRPVWPTATASEEDRAIAPWQGYEGAMALHALDSFIKGLAPVRQGLARVRCPVLAVHCATDATTPPSNVQTILSGVSSAWKRSVLLEVEETVTNHHKIATHVETRGKVVRLALDFIDEIAKS